MNTFEGRLYRALNPRWAAQPLSGAGAAMYGGRFNAKGVPALYTSLSPVTAMKEAQQVGGFQPITLIAYEAKIERLFDATDAAALRPFGVTPDTLADAGWREHSNAPTQRFGRAVVKQGFQALLVPSYAAGTGPLDHNIVLFRWSGRNAAVLRVIDDEGRLTVRASPR